MIVIFIILLIIIVVFNYYYHNREICSPSIIFAFSFLFSSIFALFYYKEYSLQLSIKTILIITLGVISFSLGCIVLKTKKIKENNEIKITEIKINNIMLIIFLMFSIVSLIYSLFQELNAVGGNISNIGLSLYKYRNMATFNNIDLNISPIVEVLTGILHASAYWFLLVLINNYLYNKKINIKILLITIVCAISNLLDGARGGIVNFLFSIIPITYLISINYKNNNFDKKGINWRIVITTSLVGIIMVLGLKYSAKLLGRIDTKNISNKEYIGMYTCAPLKNFDTFVRDFNNTKVEKIFGIHTFHNIYKLFGIDTTNTINNYTFSSVNGNNLGNVSTILFSFLADAGIIGIILLSFLMGAFCQIAYNKSNKYEKNIHKFVIRVLIYSYIFGSIFFSYFSNQFCSSVLSLGFVRYIIMWIILNYIFIARQEQI